MAHFFDLPNELILSIHDYLLPSDLACFYCLNKHIYALTALHQVDHRRLKRKFAIPLSTGTLGSTAVLVRNILRYPRAGLYVREWKIDFYRSGGWGKENDDDPEDTNHIMYPEADMILFEDAIRQSSFIPGLDKVEWVASMRNGAENVLIALAVTLLPNLRAIEIGRGWEYQGRLASVLESIGYSRPSQHTPFSSLATITIQPGEEGDSIGLAAVEAFATQPSVKTLNIHGIYAENDDLELVKPLKGANVTDVNISDSEISPQRLSLLLDNFENLQSFSYLHRDDKFVDCEFEPFLIVKALLSCGRDTLRELNLCHGYFVTGTYMGSLCKFSALESVETNFSLFVGSSAHAIDATKLFTTAFPRSLQKIKLVAVCRQNYQYTAMLEGLVRVKTDSIPYLCRVEFVNSQLQAHEERTWRAQCESVGVSLIITHQHPVVLPTFTTRRTHYAEREMSSMSITDTGRRE